jgi:hypothetical protein
MSDIMLECPHCGGIIIVDPAHINCAIFRHATFKYNGAQVDPHAKKEVCDHLVSTNQVIGCCRPFRMVQESIPPTKPGDPPTIVWKAVICDYI